MLHRLLDKYQANTRFYLTLLLIFAVATFFLGPYSVYLATAEIVAVLGMTFFIRLTSKKRNNQLLDYIESMTTSMQSVTKDTLLNFPLPVLVFSPGTSIILWANSSFISAAGTKKRLMEDRLTDLIPDFPNSWLLEGKTECPGLVTLAGRRYKVFGSINPSENEQGNSMASTYWVDVTEYADSFDDFTNSRPVCAIIMLDNYEELFKNMTEKDKSALLSGIDDKIGAWVAGSDGILCKMDRDRYLFLFEERYIASFVAEKFTVLDIVRETVGAGGFHATLSIGIGMDGKTFGENYRFATLGIDMALSRGGDQAVIKNRQNYEFYGGHSAEVEKRTKVKSRVMANAFGELIGEASTIFIMGHKYADLDSIGAAVGVCCIARKHGKHAYIVVERDSSVAENLIDKLRETPEYKNVFISAQDAMIAADSRSLLVVVDTSRPEQVESEPLLLSLNHAAVIDHHRRAATYIENATLNFHEPYASSTSELIVEMMQYLVEQPDILRIEAESLLAGIVLDTKSFAIRTGSRTFDAAAFLRRAGADTTDVKKLLQSDFDTTMERFALIRDARMYRSGIAIAVSDKPEKRILVAQAADELLNIAGVQASFVVSPDGEDVFVSARSIGTVNVQLIMEKLGGGGNQSTAGGKIKGKTRIQVLESLTSAIDAYIEQTPQSTAN